MLPIQWTRLLKDRSNYLRKRRLTIHLSIAMGGMVAILASANSISSKAHFSAHVRQSDSDYLIAVPGKAKASERPNVNGPKALIESKNWDPPALTIHPNHDSGIDNLAGAKELISDGRKLFETRFNVVDGAGRPGATGDSKPTPRASIGHQEGFNRIAGLDANSCAGCHTSPVLGGSGDFASNVFVGAHFSDPPTDSIAPQITNERNTTSILGAGAVELLAREMTTDLRSQRSAAGMLAVHSAKPVTISLISKGVSFGSITARTDGSFNQSALSGVDDDLVVKPFGVKGVAISLREFTIAALNQHHGIQAIERFGWERTGRHDFDEDGVTSEFSIGQLSALVLFQASLKPLARPDSKQFSSGLELFKTIKCATCHVPSLRLNDPVFSEPNPYNRPGSATPRDLGGIVQFHLSLGRASEGIERNQDGSANVWLFSDLRRHKITDSLSKNIGLGNELRRQDNVPTNQFLTSKLWDLSKSGPYGHRGDCTTLSEVILAHDGEARNSKRDFLKLSDAEKRRLISFLLSLGSIEAKQD